MSTISIVIPTFNGAEYLPILFNKIKEQKTAHNIELSIIDSGSQDDTVQIIKNFSKDFKIIFKQIPIHQFNHGLTRNDAIEQSSGEYIALLTQDAIPLNEYWLDNLVSPLENDPKVAGVFGRHIPRDDCNPTERKNLMEFFNGFGYKNTEYALTQNSGSGNPLDYLVNMKKDYDTNKYILAFFSDNNACIRRSVWKKIPYRNVSVLGEDQLWARDILFAGYKKVYCPHAIVIHSHNYSPMKSFQRWVDDLRFAKELHNYTISLPFWKIILFCFRNARNNIDQLKIIATPDEQKIWKWYVAKISFARVLSEYVAKRWDVIPSFLKPYLSMDEKHRRKIKTCGK